MPTLELPDAQLESRGPRVQDSWASNQHLEAATSVESRSASLLVDQQLDSSIQASSFLSAEKRFADLYSRLATFSSHAFNVGTPSEVRVGSILTQLRKMSLVPSQLVELSDEPGLGLTFYNGSRRAELEVLADGGCFLTMYDREGPIIVTEPELERDAASTITRIVQFLS